MNFFRSYNSSTVFIWITLLSIALPVTQNLQFHFHSLDHDPIRSDQHESIIVMPVEHAHKGLMHLSKDNSHADHHNFVLAEMEASPDRNLHRHSSKVPAVDLLVLCLLLFILGLHLLRISAIPVVCGVFPRQPFYRTPPARAPPH